MTLIYKETKAYDEKLIVAIYNERGRKILEGALNGQFYYFSKNSIAVQQEIVGRFNSEKAKAKEYLRNEDNY